MGIAKQKVGTIKHIPIMVSVVDGPGGHECAHDVQILLSGDHEPLEQLKGFCKRLRQSRKDGKCLEETILDAMREHNPALKPDRLPGQFADYDLEERFEVLPPEPDVAGQSVRLVRRLMLPKHMSVEGEGKESDLVCQVIWQIPMWSIHIPDTRHIQSALYCSVLIKALDDQDSAIEKATRSYEATMSDLQTKRDSILTELEALSTQTEQTNTGCETLAASTSGDSQQSMNSLTGSFAQL